MTWVAVGIGAAVGATAGAIAGTKKGGDDVWKGALLGGAVGAAGGAPFGGEAAVAADVLPAAAPELVPAAAAPAVSVPTGIATVEAPNAAAGLQSLDSGIVNPSVMTPGVEAPPGSFGTSFNTANGLPTAQTSTAAPGAPSPVQMVKAPTGGSFGGDATEPFLNVKNSMIRPEHSGDLPLGSTGQANTAGRSVLDEVGNQSLFDKTKDFFSDMNPFQAGILGFTALGLSGALNKNNNQTFGTSSVTPAGYPLSPNFKPTRVNPQQYRYSTSYADGGITSVGPQADMFPQSQMDKTQFATPSQMPVSREVVGADYDSTINPYTGDLPRFKKGGDVDWGKNAQDYSTLLAAQAAPTETPRYVSHSMIDPADPGIAVDTDLETRDQPAMTAAQTRMSNLAKKYGISYKPKSEEEKTLAMGGIADLGGYAAGGNPRLLRGPGDGMSDDIPATIADKQPARLADGEFVVPADVVSGLGNGSTEAGAKKLHQMMDKVRVDRTGTKKQGKKIKAEKYVPGMASGGIAGYADGGVPVAQDLSSLYVTDAEGNRIIPLSTLQAQLTPNAVPSVSTQPVQAQTNPSQYAMGGQQTPDYRVPGSTLSGGLGRWSNIAGEAERAARPASLNQQVTQSYLQNLGRAPDQQGFNYWMNSGLTGPQINQEIQKSGESYQMNPTPARGTDFLTSRYQDILGRAPDQAGLDYWTQQLQSGKMNVNQIDQAMRQSPEAQIAKAYQTYLGRTADQPGQQYWTNQVASGDMTVNQAINAIKSSEEGKAYAAKQSDTQKARKGGILAIKK